jgi:hypothetical protein
MVKKEFRNPVPDSMFCLKNVSAVGYTTTL